MSDLGKTTQRRIYRRPALRAFGRLTHLTRMGKATPVGMADGVGSRKTGV
ncbi:MAG: hypothetical protein HYS27_09265 [Deltaproteobacteria bacterium]|nr:hypothetical protein [Deltaproteobacteria bacterium]